MSNDATPERDPAPLDDLDADEVVADAIEYFDDDDGAAESPASDADAPAPG